MIDENQVRNTLVAKQDELQARIGGTQATEQREVAEDKNDGAQLWQVSDNRDDLDDQAVAELRQVNHALERLDSGEYGVCEDCDEPIPERRLQAVPYATLCVSCAEDEAVSSRAP